MGKLTKAIQAKQVEMRLRGFILNKTEATPLTVRSKVEELLGRPLYGHVVIDTYGYDYGDHTARGLKVMCERRRGTCMSFQFFGTEKIGDENFDCGKFVEKVLKIEAQVVEFFEKIKAQEKLATERSQQIGRIATELNQMYSGIITKGQTQLMWDGERHKSIEFYQCSDEQVFKLAAYYAQLKREQKHNETTTHQG